MRSRILPVVGVSAAALIAATAVAPMATASSPDRASKTPASVSSNHKSDGVQVIAKKGKCKTMMGTFADNGIISWESPANGFDAAGAADFTCGKKKKSRTFSTVTVIGYFGGASGSNFDITVYNDLNGEPDNNSTPVCATTGVGNTDGNGPTETTIKLDKACKANKGTNWLEVQKTGDDSSWYWGVQSEVGAKYPADFRDTTGAFGTPCTPGYQDGLYMQDCIFGGDNGTPDFIFALS